MQPLVEAQELQRVRALAVLGRQHCACVPMVAVGINVLGSFRVVAVGRTARDAVATPQTVQVHDCFGLNSESH